MASPFQSSDPGPSNASQHQSPFQDPQGLGMGPNPMMVPVEDSESQGMMDSASAMGAAGSSTGGASTSSQPQPQKDFNMALLCRFGQETVQEIVSKTTELFQMLKTMQPPGPTAQGMAAQEERKAKLQETLKSINLSFKKLRRIYEKCNENCAGMEYTHIEVDSLVPLKDEVDQRTEDKKMSDSMKYATEEHKELVEQVMLRNRQLKEVIDNLRTFIWDINTMLCMRRP